jgi:hypothetical protein
MRGTAGGFFAAGTGRSCTAAAAQWTLPAARYSHPVRKRRISTAAALRRSRRAKAQRLQSRCGSSFASAIRRLHTLAFR